MNNPKADTKIDIKIDIKPDTDSMPLPQYPLSALVAQDDLKLCLLLLALEPRLGGLLIQGDKGAAKSTAARGLAELLPAHAGKAAPFINLPLGTSEDRLLGSLDLEHALQGERRVQQGLLAQADGGLLYVDEVNLLPDHLVDHLLDAAATGVHYLEREGLSLRQHSRFALIGSMNPEEGKLRPQFLDRFGLCVQVYAPTDTASRANIIQQRLAFERDPQAFIKNFAAAQQKLKETLEQAQSRLPQIHYPEAMMLAAAERCQSAGIASLRADLVLSRAAIALAALQDDAEVSIAHLEAVMPFVFLHRQAGSAAQRPQQPPSAPQETKTDSETNSETGSKTGSETSLERKNQAAQQSSEPAAQPPTSTDNADNNSDGQAGRAMLERIFTPTEQQILPFTLPKTNPNTVTRPNTKQRNAPNLPEAQGRFTGSHKTAQPQHLALADSLRHALSRSALAGTAFTKLSSQDLHSYTQKASQPPQLLIVLDSSGSLAARQRMASVKGLLADVLAQCDEARYLLSLITFRAQRAEHSVPWTRDIHSLQHALDTLPTGGRTPLAHALELAQNVLQTKPHASLLLLSDGKSNVPLQSGSDPWQDALHAATPLQAHASLVIDTEEGAVKLARASQLAAAMQADYVPLSELLLF